MKRPLCSEARYCSIAAAPARADGRLGTATTSVPRAGFSPGTEVGKYRTEGNVGRGPLAVGKTTSRGGPAASASATALFVVPKSRPTQRALTLVAGPRSDRARWR